MKTILKYTSILSILLSFSCCVNQKKKDEEQIKETVQKFWEKAKINDFEGYRRLIADPGVFSGVMQVDLNFIHKNYDKINPNDILLKDIKVKDTSIAGPNMHQKYVQYVIKKENDTNYVKKPLIITLLFYKPGGYDKIFNRKILQNHIGWAQ
ncbi:hypothetical protein [Chryseobacterium fistulae]|uniref:Nuclear transport factor 2 family protein n=1 Tax=Chryseobacterium fistulae TaxID=2675058 RepID=A0A6N4XS51_9FLAO|nr:hypothetical protein [Chryseobacterium fistulae]CAA7391641.1 hypothetical protein CHRY9393_02947 [Chryseobacterium fistulae]